MPYVNDTARFNLVNGSPALSPGELNYLISKAVHDYVESKKVSYAVCNEVIGVLDCAKLEFYRTVVAPYEDRKRLENGPVSELDAMPKRKGRKAR